MFVTGIVHIFCSDWVDCRGTSRAVLCFVMLRNRHNKLKTKCNSHFNYSAIDSLGMHLD